MEHDHQNSASVESWYGYGSRCKCVCVLREILDLVFTKCLSIQKIIWCTAEILERA